MDYREYRKKYAPGGTTDRTAAERKNGAYARRTSAQHPQESPTGSVTRHFTTDRNVKKRYAGNNTNTASARIVMAAIIALTLILVLVTVLLFVTNDSLNIPDCLYSKIVVEAGRSSVSATDFLVYDSHTAVFADGTDYSLNKVGSYRVRIRLDSEKTYTCTLQVRDTVAPTGEGVSITIRKDRDLEASSCVTNVKDATKVSISYLEEPDTSKTGDYAVVVLLRDGGGNETQIKSSVKVVEAASVLNYSATVEAGGELPDVTAFVGIDGEGEYYSDISAIDTSVPGIYSPEILVGKEKYTVQITVTDTVAPTGTVTAQLIYNDGDFPDPAKFVSDIVDATEVEVSYAETPVKTGSYPVSVKIKLTDLGGNSTVYDSYVNSATDYTPPVIEVLSSEIEVRAGDAIIWRSNIKVSDNSGETPEVTLDLNGADAGVPGTYTVYYVATDPAGNRTTSQATLSVRDISYTDEDLEKAVKTLVNKIMTSNMTALQQMKALWVWMSDNKADQLKYSNSSAHDDWKREAYLALTTRKSGDCFAYASVAQAVFRYLGYDTVIVQRAEEYRYHGTHFWIMVNLGTETNPKWYHFDGTPITGRVRIESYGLTTAQLKAYTLWRNDVFNDETEEYYVFNESDYPESADEIIRGLELNGVVRVPDSYFNG